MLDYVSNTAPSCIRLNFIHLISQSVKCVNAFQLHDGFLYLRVHVPVDETRSIVVQSNNAQDFASISTSKKSLYVFVLRKLSDFRDITLSRVEVGRKFTTLYYSHRGTAEVLILCGCSLIVFCAVGGWWLFGILIGKKVVQSSLGCAPNRRDRARSIRIN